VVLPSAQGFLALLALGFLDSNVVTCELHVGEGPVINVVVPLCTTFNPHVFKGGYKLVNQEVLQADFSSQFADSVHQVLTLTVNFFLQVIQLVASLDHFSGELIGKFFLVLKFILL
jgi:hypothetical protein